MTADPLETLRAAQDALESAEAVRDLAIAERAAAVHLAREAGHGVPEIAETLGVDRQTVYRIIRR